MAATNIYRCYKHLWLLQTLCATNILRLLKTSIAATNICDCYKHREAATMGDAEARHQRCAGSTRTQTRMAQWEI